MGSEPRTESSETGAREARRIGPYRITRRLAIGGMSEVFLAESAEAAEPSEAAEAGESARATAVRARHVVPIGLRVVLKLPLPEVARARVTAPVSGTSDPTASMEHEAELLARLVHPHIVRTFGCVPVEDADPDAARAEAGLAPQALVLEYVDGPSLDVLLAAMAPATPTAATSLRVVLDLLSALEVAHAAVDSSGLPLGLVHRDVNPRNVLLTRDGVVKLADFGIARSRLSRARTRTGAIRGTLKYLAPEQATGSDVDARTDLYAIGLLAFELLVGEPHARGQSELDLIREAENPAKRELPVEVPVGAEVRAAITTALRRFAEERHASAGTFAAKLAPFAAPPDIARAELAALVARFTPPDPRDTRDAPDSRPPRAPSVETSSADEVSRRTERMPPTATIPAALGGIVVAALLVAYVASTRHVEQGRPATDTARRAAAIAPQEPPTSGTTTPVTPSAVRAGLAQDDTRGRAVAAAAAASAAAEPARARATTPSVDRPVATSPRLSRESEPTAQMPNSPSSSPGHALPHPDSLPVASATVDAEAPALGRDAVRRDLGRTNDAIRLARERGEDVGSAQALARTALEAYAEGRYADASVILARIRGLVTRPE